MNQCLRHEVDAWLVLARLRLLPNLLSQANDLLAPDMAGPLLVLSGSWLWSSSSNAGHHGDGAALCMLSMEGPAGR